MSETYYISDHHFQHRGILAYEAEARPFTNVDDHDEWLIRQHNLVVQPEDTVWFGGDVCFGNDKSREKVLRYLARMNGTKNLLLGNHDRHPLSWYAKSFDKVMGCIKVGEVSITHIPVHPDEFNYRVDYNLHGHIHSRKLVQDSRYINMCIEHCNGVPRTLDQWLKRK